MHQTDAMLSVRDLHVSYSRVRALKGCDLHIPEGAAVAVIGANGAGKTTLLRAISNLVPRDSGTVEYLGKETGRKPPYDLAREGMLHIPEGRGTIARLTVRENLRLAYDIKPSPIDFAAALEKVASRFPRIRERLSQSAGTLSGGEQQMLSLARAVINPPRLLLVDEPSLGLSPAMTSEAFQVLRQLRDDGITILLVEQNVRRALQFAQYTYVLRIGRIVLEASSAELREKTDLLAHYLGSTGGPRGEEKPSDAATGGELQERPLDRDEGS